MAKKALIVLLTLCAAQFSFGALNWSAGNFIGLLDPSESIIDPDTGGLVSAGSLVYLIYDADGDGADVAADGFSPTDDDILILNPDAADGQFRIGDGAPTGVLFTPDGGISSTPPLENNYLNSFVDTNGALDGEMGLFYVRVFDVADPTTAGEFNYGDSIDTNPNTVDATTPDQTGGYFKYTETDPGDPTIQQWTVGPVTLDTKVPEPSTFLLLALGLLGLTFIGRRKKEL